MALEAILSCMATFWMNNDLAYYWRNMATWGMAMEMLQKTKADGKDN